VEGLEAGEAGEEGLVGVGLVEVAVEGLASVEVGLEAGSGVGVVVAGSQGAGAGTKRVLSEYYYCDFWGCVGGRVERRFVLDGSACDLGGRPVCCLTRWSFQLDPACVYL
jgi:hypothetical protein